MEIVVTHEMADFDALASAVAAQKLHPRARIVLGRAVGRGVRDFLALHKERFPTLRSSEVRQGEVTKVVIVDVRGASRLGELAVVRDRILAADPSLEVHVWDHHAASDDDVPASVQVVERVGSATTLLLEEIRRVGLDVAPIEATLFALGIHVDTGSLTYSGTSARDAHAMAWLLERGARLDVLNRYLEPPMSPAQRRALSALLAAVTLELVSGVPVGLGVVRLERAIDGLDLVTSEVLALHQHHALFALFVLGDKRIQVVARARSAWIDVGRVLRSVGGGGHATAAAAMVKHANVDLVTRTVLESLRANPPRPTRVADLMSSPVQTVAHDVPMAALRDSLQSWRCTGAPILRDGALVGIVSRRDVERASRGGRLGLPASGCMTHPVLTTTEDATLDDALARMQDADVGRLPVLRDGRLVGIVTRSDVLAALYGPERAPLSRRDAGGAEPGGRRARRSACR